jgi:hypothetical protein
MADPPRSLVNRYSRWKSWLDAPISRTSCVIGWCLSTTVFVVLVVGLGGPAPGDWPISGFSTWAIAHGQFRCAFPSRQILVPFLYPLFAGAIAAMTRIGDSVPFPVHAVAGKNCGAAFNAMYQWSMRAKALHETLAIGYLAWPILLVGTVAWLRASGRGRRGWEPFTLLIVACLPPVWMCLESVFHPHDLVAMGISLGALACVRRDQWIAAGVLIGLAFMTQQFTLLVAAPLLVLAPRRHRVSYAGAAIGAVLLVSAPFLWASSGSALHALTVGGGDSSGLGGAVLWQLHFQGKWLLLTSRIPPLVLSLALAWWVLRRLGRAAFEPVPLLALVALSLSLRLVFEQSLYSYYFMPLTVTLVLLEVARGHFRANLIAWLVLVPTLFGVGPAGTSGQYAETGAERAFSLALVAVACVALVARALWLGSNRQTLIWVAVLVFAPLVSPVAVYPLGWRPSVWLLQLFLVTFGIGLAARPLLDWTTQPGASPGEHDSNRTILPTR